MAVLDQLGWGPFFASQLSDADRDLVPGRVVTDLGPYLLVHFEDGERTATVPGRLKAARETPAVGDFVLAPPGGAPAVARVLARRTHLSRGAAGRETREQVLAANVDVVFVVQGLDAGPNPRRIERSLAAVHAGGAEPVVVLTKGDLVDDPEGALAEARAVAAGAPVLAANGKVGLGVAELTGLLHGGRTGVFVGPSGAGKSTLVNAILGDAVQAVGDVRASDRRGRHTTASRRLFPLPGGGAVIDGPGIRELRLWEAEGVAAVFDDVAALAAGCRFSDCRHAGEPGCAVVAAVEAGALAPERLASFLKLQDELASLDARQGGAAARAEKARWRAVSKEIRRFQKWRGDGE